MAFGNVSKEKLIDICQNLNENIIIKAIENIANIEIPTPRNSSTHFIIFKNNKYPLKYVMEFANNNILNNEIKIGPNTQYSEDSWTMAAVLQELIPNPQNFIVITPYNKNGQNLVQDLRENLINTLHNLGYTADNTPRDYTAIKTDKNIAEIHYVQKKIAKFKVVIDYDALSDNLKQNCRRVPDSHGWKLNGEYWVNSESSLENVLEKIKYIANLDTKSQNIKKTKYWMYSAGLKSSFWDIFYKENIMAIGWEYLGDLTHYQNQKEIAEKIQPSEKRTQYPTNDSKANWEFANEINIGDIVYVKQGLEPILLGRGVVISDYIYDNSREKYKSIRKIKWTHKGNFAVDFNELDIKQWNQKTLTDISQDKYGDFCLKIEKIFNNQTFERGTAMKDIPLNQILYGPPGTGKTYSTILKAMSIIDGEEYKDVSDGKYSELKIRFDELKQTGQIEFVTFHQSYSYEEFVEGIKPYIPEWGSASNTNINYVGTNGIFKDICKKASKDLYKLVNNSKTQSISFDTVLNIFKEKYPQNSDFENLLSISYENNNLIYHFGKQEQDRKIDLLKIKKLFNLNKQYRTSADFNKEYGGNVSLKGYYHTFYKELMSIKDAIEEENRISIENNQEYTINQDATKYILIIDEINRGDVSKIFGELITLIEEDKRIGSKYQMKTTLPYSKEQFGVPKNLYIIGTMNTADRSIALLDTALRRRFDFEEIMPKPELLADKLDIGEINLEKLLRKINKRITKEYDRDHQIGHSYLINIKDEKDLERAYKNRILPLLNEYFYNDAKTVSQILNCKENELQGNFLEVLNKAQNS